MSAIGAPQVTGDHELAIGAEASRHTGLRLETALLALILLLAAFLRFHQIDNSSLWSDEGNTWALVQRTFSQIAQDAAADIHPPGYYWLLKLWSGLFGLSAASLRTFSALCGVILVVVIERVARLTAPSSVLPGFSLLAAFLAALNPFQIYYSQEARMYMLLALECAGLFWAMLAMVSQWGRERAGQRRFGISGAEMGYFVCGVAGLWTHYTFPVILAAAIAAFYLLHWQWARQPEAVRSHEERTGWRFLFLNLLIVLAFLPWLPTAIDQVLAWPKGGQHVAVGQGATLFVQTLLFGPLRTLPDPLWPWLLAAGLLPLVGIVALRRARPVIALVLWLLAPIILMFGAGLFSAAFLKFMLVASAPWCVLVAGAAFILHGRLRWLAVAAVAVWAALPALLTLPVYFTDSSARDNYKGVAAYLAAIGKPETDMMILDAPGQSDVWRYYDPGLKTVALPQQRPANREETVAELAAAVAGRRNVYALFWATDESDPGRIVETWLDQNAFKGLESWQGNLRFVRYVQATDLDCQEGADLIFDMGVTLTGQCQPQQPQRVAGGDVATVQLQWQAQQQLTERYKVSVQLLDVRDQVIAQHDSEPAGASRPTTTWRVGETVLDNHGVAVPLGVPPGVYRLAAVVYNGETGQRLVHAGGDLIELGVVEVLRAERPLSPALLPVQQRLDVQLGPVMLIGADAYKKDFAHAPETPLRAGDTLHVTLYWQSPTPLPAEWPADLGFALTLGEQSVTAPLAGGAYPTGEWLAGDVVRGEFDLLFDGSARRPVIRIGADEVELASLPVAD